MAQKSASGLSGYTYELPAYVYPRYQYFQSNFTDLKKYFKRLEASGKFHQCISEGDKKLASFYEETERLGSTVTVSVFSEDQKFISTIEKIFLVNQLSEEDKWKKEPASLVKYIEDIGASTDKLEVTVIVVDTLDKELLKDLSLMCQHLTDLQKTMFVLYYRKLSRSYNLTDLESAGFSPAALEDQDASLTFPQHIQNILEARVVGVLEWMIDFLDDLLPHRTERQGQNFVSFICSDFFVWYENQPIMDDLSPVPKTPGTLSLPAESSQLPAAKLDELFKKKLLEYLSQKTRCRCCDYLGKAYGLKSSLTNYFLEKSLSFEERFKKEVTITTLPTYDDLRTNRSYMFRTFSYTCSDLIRPFLGEVEKFVLKLLEVLERMRRLQFIAQCLLRLTKVKLISKVPDIPKLSPVMQNELLNLPYVTGCGTIFGRLMIHISSSLNLQQEEEIEEILKTNKYSYPYKTEVFSTKIKMQAGGELFRQGSLIRAKKIDSHEQVKKKTQNPYEFSSLGCFVEVTTTGGSKKVHFVTCDHCVCQCEPYVEAKPEQASYTTFGTVTFQCPLADVALVEVREQEERNIKKSLKKPLDMGEFATWQFCDSNEVLIGRSVYKVGAYTKLTNGRITSEDYMVSPQEGQQLKKILIYPLHAIDMPENTSLVLDEDQEPMETGGPFSEDGDSGSAVCDADVDTGDGLVIALLRGCLTNLNDVYECSFGCVMQTALEHLKNANGNITHIEPAL